MRPWIGVFLSSTLHTHDACELVVKVEGRGHGILVNGVFYGNHIQIVCSGLVFGTGLHRLGLDGLGMHDIEYGVLDMAGGVKV